MSSVSQRKQISAVLLLISLTSPLFAKPVISSHDFTKLTATLKDQSKTDKMRLFRGKDGFIRFIGAPPLNSFKVEKIAEKTEDAVALSFIRENANLFGLLSKNVRFKTKHVNYDGKYTFVYFQQTYDNVPIWGGEINLQLESQDSIVSVLSDIMTDSTVLDTGKLVTTPRITSAESVNVAVGFISSLFPGIALDATEPNLMIYEPSVVGNSGPTRLVWGMSILDENISTIHEFILVDAMSGEIVLHFSRIMTDCDRHIYDANGTAADPGTLVRWDTEGQGACGIVDADSAYDYFGDAYDFYLRNHFRDGINGWGMQISATVRFRSNDPRYWDNAWWNGSRFYFDTSRVTDDIVAHEYTHGVTQYNGRGGLEYLNESGAINESFSDMWGEFVDLGNGRGTDTNDTRWFIGEDLPGGLAGAWRNMADPPSRSSWLNGQWVPMPDRYRSPNFYQGTDDWGGVHHNSSVGNKLVYLLTDGDTFNGHTVTGMGIERVARLFYRVQTNSTLPSTGADYEDLYNTLTQAAIDLNFTLTERNNIEEACSAVEIKPVNTPPILSNPRVNPIAGPESTTFEFFVDYYDADGDPPHSDYRTVTIVKEGEIFRKEKMTLKTGSPADGTYSYSTNLPTGSYKYLFFFADTKGEYDDTPVQFGPYVGTWIVELNIEVSGGPVTDNIEVKFGHGPDLLHLEYQEWDATQLPQIVQVNSSEQLMFVVSVDCESHNFIEWVFRDDNGNIVARSSASGYGFILGSGNIHATAYFSYNMAINYTISGTVLRGDNSPVPGGVDLTLTSPVQTMSQHTDNGNFSFMGVFGGVPVTITPSAKGYEFSPPKLFYANLCSDQTGHITAYAADNYVPMISFIVVPPSVSESSSVSFSWIGEDNVSPPEKLQYRYKLDDVDTDWSAWVSVASQTYDVNNGAYIFWVSAQDEAGNINQAPTSYKFVVNAAPKLIAAERINSSVWASRITLEMPVGASHPTDKFVLLLSHSGINDAELVPVTIHQIDVTNPCGANAIIASQLGLPTRITQATTGWLVTLPQSIPAGQTAQYDIVWGKIKYFGWREFETVPRGFPNLGQTEPPWNKDSGYVENQYLDENLRLWRLASRQRRYSDVGMDQANWALMNQGNADGLTIEELPLRFNRGQPYLPGVPGNCTTYRICSAFKDGPNICLLWHDDRYEWDGSTDYYYERYGLQIFDNTGNAVVSSDGSYYNQVYLSFPYGLIHDSIWITAEQHIGSKKWDPYEGWFIVLDKNGNETISKTIFDTIQNTNGAELYMRSAFPLGSNVLMLWQRHWNTDNDDARQEIAYQVRNASGQIVKNTSILSPPLSPDTVTLSDEYNIWDIPLTDNEGKVWISFRHEKSGQTTEYFYIVLDSDGTIWKEPNQTSNLRTFRYCDKDGYIWATEGSQFFALNPNDTIAYGPRSSAYIPNQKVGEIAASVAVNSYRLYDRWTPQPVQIDVPTGANDDLMELFSLNLWANDLYPANLNLKKGDTSIWNQAGQFTGHTTINISGALNEGQNLLLMTQDDFLGGQVLVTFTYLLPQIDIGLRVYDGTAIVKVACEPQGTLTSPLRIAKNGVIYGIVLVEPSDPAASKLKIQTSSGTKALRKF